MTRTTGLLLALTILLGILCLPACSPFQSDNQDSEPPPSPEPPTPTSNDFDPGVVTPGYILFEGDTEGMMVSFEYPDDWVLEAPIPTSIGERMDLHFGYQNYITLQFSSEVLINSYPRSYSAPLSFHFKDASELLEKEVSEDLGKQSFQNISSGRYMLGIVEGEEATYACVDIITVSNELGISLRKNAIYRHIVADYKDRIYWVRMRLDTDIDKYEDYNPDFEHLLATFRFLE